MRLSSYITEKAGIFEPHADYQIRKVTNKHYQVSKWVKGDRPTEVYDIYDTNKGWSCNCAVRGTCKHITMCKEWIKNGMPNVWDPKDIGKSFRELIGEKE